MTIIGILGVFVMIVLLKLVIKFFKSVGKDVVSGFKKNEIIDDINTKPKKQKKG